MANDNVKHLRDFYSKIKGEGLRVSHQFQLQFGGNGIPAGFNDYIVYAYSAALPGRQIVTEDVPFYGFPFKVPVNTTYSQEWSMSIRCDTNLKIRALFEDWYNNIADLSKSTGGSKGVVPSDAYALVHMLDPAYFNNSGSGKIVRTYRLEGIFPSNMGDITLDHTSSAISTFDMTFAFQYWYIESANVGKTGDPLK